MSGALSRTLVWTYGLAFVGVHLAFMPLLVLMLPRRVEVVAGDDASTVLSWLLLTGGVVAGLAHILAGALSDRWFVRHGNRRGLLAIGTALLGFAYIGLSLAHSTASLFAAVVFFQLCLNICFAPMGALLADHIPDEHKGRMGGLINAALPVSTLLVVPVAWLFPADSSLAFLLVGGIAVACIVPLLVSWRFEIVIRNRPQPVAGEAGEGEPANPRILADFSKAWVARLLIQTGAAFVIGYIYIYIAATKASVPALADVGSSEILAFLTAPTALLAILATVVGGYLSDMRSARRFPLLVSALLVGSGLALLALAPQPIVFIIAYGLFQIGLAAFLSIDTALVAQLVGGHPRRGALLGVMNLSNTFPAIIAPLFALMALETGEIAGALGTIFGVLAFGAVMAGMLVLFIRSVR